MKRVFIANQGEVCRRIAMSVVDLGLEAACPIAPDIGLPSFLCPWISATAVLEPYEPSSFLDIERMVTMAVDLGCDAIHPGFGFLSESHAFATAVQEKGLYWIGPPPSAMLQMADKALARQVAQKAQVPCVPGLQSISHVDHLSVAKVQSFARQVGYPILVKAALGGGGKGMRVIHREEEIEEAMERAYSEACASFGSGVLLVEKYVVSARHIEVQVLADSQGQVYILGDRDCSLQRRNQKVVEEAPAPGLSLKLRQQMQRAAASLSQSVNYVSAGTVEFILDVNACARGEEQFYFLEMNTRLQVEHPVTEEVFGVDIVAEQIRIAQGQEVSEHVRVASPRGCAIEVRIYAENVLQNYMPYPGPVLGMELIDTPWVRWEYGVSAGGEVSSRFDPMIAKLVVWGQSRQAAIQRVIMALDKSMLAAPVTNISFVRALMLLPEFQAVEMTTRTLEEMAEDLCSNIRAGMCVHQQQAEVMLQRLYDARHLLLSATVAESVSVDWTTALQRSAFLQGLQGEVKDVAGLDTTDFPPTQLYKMSQDLYVVGRLVSCAGFYALRKLAIGKVQIFCQIAGYGYWQEFSEIDSSLEEEHDSQGALTTGADHVVAPVPGKIVSLKVEVGEQAPHESCIAVLESMKMEFEILAPRDVVIAGCSVRVGELVKSGSVIYTFQPTSS
ncbi:MAG: ATP-grasp domain-containing protein [Zetaproteobacteria bacterium]|nr:ATP-grasp domain-containing protein [Zetaproteobacteria bacterium]